MKIKFTSNDPRSGQVVQLDDAVRAQEFIESGHAVPYEEEEAATEATDEPVDAVEVPEVKEAYSGKGKATTARKQSGK